MGKISKQAFDRSKELPQSTISLPPHTVSWVSSIDTRRKRTSSLSTNLWYLKAVSNCLQICRCSYFLCVVNGISFWVMNNTFCGNRSNSTACQQIGFGPDVIYMGREATLFAKAHIHVHIVAVNYIHQ